MSEEEGGVGELQQAGQQSEADKTKRWALLRRGGRSVLESFRRQGENVAVSERLFVRDRESEQKAPELLTGVSFFKFENFFDTLPSAVRAGEVEIDRLGVGNEGFVFRVKEGEKDLAIKLYYDSLRSSDLRKIFKSIPLTDHEKMTIMSKHNYNPEVTRSKILQGVGGHVLGHSIAPDYIDEPDGIFTFRGEPIGFTMPVIEGEGVDIVDVPEVAEVQQRLLRANVAYDNVGVNNMIRYTDDQGEHIKILDLDTSARNLDNDPRIKHEGEYWVRRLDPEENTDISDQLLSYKDYQSRINAFNGQQSESRSRLTPYTFEDQLDGTATKTSVSEYEEYQMLVNELHSFNELCNQHKIDLTKGTLMLNVGEIQYFHHPFTETAGEVETLIDQSLTADYTDNTFGRHKYYYSQSSRLEDGSDRTILVSFRDGILSYNLYAGDAEPCIINVDSTTKNVTFSDENLQPRTLTPAEEATTIQTLRDTLRISELDDSQAVFASVLNLLPQKTNNE